MNRSYNHVAEHIKLLIVAVVGLREIGEFSDDFGRVRNGIDTVLRKCCVNDVDGTVEAHPQFPQSLVGIPAKHAHIGKTYREIRVDLLVHLRQRNARPFGDYLAK